MKIGEKTLQTIPRLVEGLLREHMERLNQAWLNAGENDLKISLSATLKSGKNGNIDQEVKISYVVDKEEDTAKASVNEKQTNIFEQEERIIPCPLHPDIDGVVESICDKCSERFRLVFVSGEGLPKLLTREEALDLPPLKKGQMLQTCSCRSWDDYDYKQWCDWMVDKEITPKEEPKPEKKKKNKKK
ncbi:MAG: hypothetical protein PHN44_06780 [Candidatus Marinimicrobia bacterium]|nr:hypothetical protein [Candidatus Neomarinimicrobiota bacterium]